MLTKIVEDVTADFGQCKPLIGFRCNEILEHTLRNWLNLICPRKEVLGKLEFLNSGSLYTKALS